MNQKKGPHKKGPNKSSRACNDEDATSRTLYVKINKSRPPNDLSAITNGHFREHFQYFEEVIQRCNVIFDYDTGLPKGFGFVTFKSRNAASRAMDYFQGSMLGGRHKLNISFKLQKQVSRPRPNLIDKENTPTVKPIASNIRDDTIIEFKDEVIGLMMMEDENGPLRAVASREGVELCPLLAPRLGFQMKGDRKGVKVVKNYCNQLRITMEQNSIGYEQMVLNTSYQPVFDATEVAGCRKSVKKALNVVATCSFEKHVFYQAGVHVTQNHVTFIRIVVGDLLTEQTDAIVIPTGRAVDNQHTYPVELASLAGRRLENTTRELVEVGETETLNGGELPCSYVIQALFPLTAQKLTDNESCDLVICNSLSRAMQMNLGSIAFPGIKTQFIKSIFDGLHSLGSTSLHTVTVVVGTKFEAKGYETAVHSLLSSNARVETGVVAKSYDEAVNDPGSAAAAVLIGSSDFVWSWREDDGSFTPYSAVDTDALNKSYHNGKSTCSLSINHMAYKVDFTTMKQVNLSTCKPRDVIKLTNEGSSVKKTSNSSLQSHVPWKYQDDFGRFTLYSPADSTKIEAMFQQQDESSRIIIQKRTYRFDFKLMKQINIFTGFDRDVQRVESPSLVARCKPVFLSDDKLVINLKGPQQNLTEAKQQLEKKIAALLFSKMVPLPASVPPSLHQHLQAIAKKHRISCISGEDTAGEASNVYQHSLKLEGLESCVKGALTEVQELILQFQASSEHLAGSVVRGSQYPQEWDPMSDRDLVKIVHLSSTSAECQIASRNFRATMSSAYIIKVQRVQNKELWQRYMQCMNRLHEKNAGGVNVKYLFHGTRGEPGEKICKSEEGFDMRFSREGMWGQANYFAANASYSDTYSHHNKTNGTRELIVAKVLTGDSYYSPSDRNLRMPPEKRQRSAGENQLQQVRYDSVNGKTSGSVVYMTYSNDRAYPAYIITYSRTEPAGYSEPAQPVGIPQAASSNVITPPFHAAQQPSQVLTHPNVPAHAPPQAQAQPPTPPPLLKAAKQIAASFVSRVAQKKAENNDKCTIS